jgi:hypothetical protein
MRRSPTGFGCFGATVMPPDQLVALALASGLPSVIDYHTRFVPHPCLPAWAA